MSDRLSALNAAYAKRRVAGMDTRFMAPEVIQDYIDRAEVQSGQVLALFDVLMDRIETLEMDVKELRGAVRWLEEEG